MLKKDYLLLLYRRFNILYGKNRLFSKIYISYQSVNKKEKLNSVMYFKKFLRKRNKNIIKLFFKNPLLLSFFIFNSKLKDSLNFLVFFSNFIILDVFNFFIKKLKTSKIEEQIKNYIFNKLMLKKNKLILKFIFLYLYKKNIDNKLRLKILNLFLFFISKKEVLINSIKNVNKLMYNKDFNKLYIIHFLKKIEKKYNLLKSLSKKLIYSKKKRYKFISFFL